MFFISLHDYNEPVNPVKDIGILGGGISGLSLACFLEKPFEVLEKNPECGGLFERFQKDGFTFDVFGCHIFFTKNKAVKDFVKSLFDNDLLAVSRKNKIYLKGRFVVYPIENGLGGLEKEDAARCLTDYVNQHLLREAGKADQPKNFREWLVYRFGKHMAELYLIPYNEKVWKTDTSLISLDWVSGIVPQPPLEDVIKSALGIETRGGIIEQLDALYPKHGGFKTITDRMEARLGNSIIKNFNAESLSGKGGCWHVSNGKEERCYKKLVSTIPLPELISRIEDAPADVKASAKNLRFNSLISVMVAVDGECNSDLTAVYFPEKKFLFNRVGILKNYSPLNVPEGKSAFIAEITTPPSDKTWDMSDSLLAENVVSALEEAGMLKKDRVLFTRVARTKYAYIVYDFGYKKNIETINKFIEGAGITPLGRFGQFEYLLSNLCIENAMDVAGKLNRQGDA